MWYWDVFKSCFQLETLIFKYSNGNRVHPMEQGCSAELWAVGVQYSVDCMAGQERRGVLSILTCGDLRQLPSVFLLRGQFVTMGLTRLGLQTLINNSAPPCRSGAGVQIRALLPWNQPIFLISSSAEWKGAERLKEAESVGVKSHLHSTGKREKGRAF